MDVLFYEMIKYVFVPGGVIASHNTGCVYVCCVWIRCLNKERLFLLFLISLMFTLRYLGNVGKLPDLDNL